MYEIQTLSKQGQIYVFFTPSDQTVVIKPDISSFEVAVLSRGAHQWFPSRRVFGDEMSVPEIAVSRRIHGFFRGPASRILGNMLQIMSHSFINNLQQSAFLDT